MNLSFNPKTYPARPQYFPDVEEIIRCRQQGEVPPCQQQWVEQGVGVDKQSSETSATMNDVLR